MATVSFRDLEIKAERINRVIMAKQLKIEVHKRMGYYALDLLKGDREHSTINTGTKRELSRFLSGVWAGLLFKDGESFLA